MDARERLIDAAETLITRDGVQAFSLREAARAVRLDPAMVYRYFEDRDDLVCAVADRGLQKLAKAMRSAAARQKGDSTERLRLYGRVYVRFALKEPELFRVMFGPARERGLEGDTPLSLLVTCLEDFAADRGVQLDAQQAAALCWASVHGLATLALDGALARSQPRSVNELTERMLDVLVSALGTAARSGRR